MKKYPFWMICYLAVSIVLSSCGTAVDTGRNNEPRAKTASKKLDELGEQSCFGSSQAEPEIVTLWCAGLKDHQGHYFEKLSSLLCNEKKLFNLFLPECGWTGAKGENAKTFILPIEHTDVNNKNTTSFYYMSAYSLTLGKSKKSLKDLLFLAYSQPAEFKKKFVFPDNTEVRPHERGVYLEGQDEVLSYDMDITGSVSKIRFSSELRGYDVKEHFEVVSERLVTGKDITMRRVVHLSYPLEDGRNKVVILEEFEVPDHGLHDIAFKVLSDHDENRMRLFYDNYQIKD